MKKYHIGILTAAVCVAVIAAIIFLRSNRDHPVRVSGMPTSTGSASESAAPSNPLRPLPPPALAIAREPDEPTPEMIEAATTATAQIKRADETTVDRRALEGFFDRVYLNPNEVVILRVFLRNLKPNEPVRIAAEDGGSLNHRLGPINVVPKAADETFEFQYAVGMHTGKYKIFITQGNRQELFDFWVGPEPPTGKPGPYREFNPDKRKA